MTDLIDKKASFTLTILHMDEQVHDINTAEHKEIKVNTKAHKELVDWANRNTLGWSRLDASIITDIIVTQENFKLLYNPKGSVVISFVDIERNSQQYEKEIKPGELDFLLDD